ncbi:MAG TPA: sigma factor [Trichocoleus sp.]
MKPQTACHTKIEDLLVAYHQNPSADLYDQLVRLNVGLVRKLVHRICQQRNTAYAEIEAAGFRGLTVAIETYDSAQGLPFSSFAIPCIQKAVLALLDQPQKSSTASTLLKKIGQVPIFRFIHLT